MKILVPDTIPLELDATRDELVRYDVTVPIPPALRDAEVLVVWRNTDKNLRDAATLPGLRLVQTLATGPDQILAAGFSPETVLASGRSLHDGPVAECLSRRVPRSSSWACPDAAKAPSPLVSRQVPAARTSTRTICIPP
ncbi:hypothetical protein [Rathayibacter sp. SD072]|uniref:hypothetical protein n=1 Tax=Rathayibacter sp. SD072 TaxID=2781731 RepID=UPI001A969124|nr:hypothetical protein [Rathayibacter sp. SD072]MBO0982666.1 hypothetical protein [Rathayibacter sp. SD072]